MFKQKAIKSLIAAFIVLAMSVGMVSSLGGKAKAATVYTVQFFVTGGQNCKNGNKDDLKKTYTAGSYVTMPNYYTKSGYTFTGWKLNNGSNKIYKANECVEVKGNMQFIAQWTKGVTECAHNLLSVNNVTKKPTCTQKGERSCKCMVCNNTWKKTIPANGHDYAGIVPTRPTCTKSGRDTRTCKTCGYTITVATFSPLGHKCDTIVGSKDSDVIKLKCSRCGYLAEKGSEPRNLDQFADYLFDKKYDKLNSIGLWFWTTDKEECTAKWLSYMTGMTYKQAKETCKAYDGNYDTITIKDVKALTTFIGKCNTLASKYNFRYAGAISSALSKFSLAMCIIDPDISTSDKVLTVVGKIAPTSAKIVKQYKEHFDTMYKAMMALSEKNYSKTFAVLMETDIYNHFGTSTPSYSQLFDNDGAGINWICSRISNGKVSFKGMCDSVNSGNGTYLLDYKCLVKYIIAPAQDALVQECFSGCSTTFINNKPSGETAIDTILKWIYKFI